jgi:hypothetical protein
LRKIFPAFYCSVDINVARFALRRNFDVKTGRATLGRTFDINIAKVVLGRDFDANTGGWRDIFGRYFDINIEMDARKEVVHTCIA